MSAKAREGDAAPSDLLVAGAFATAALTVAMYAARDAGIVKLDLPLLLGTFLRPPVWRARLFGLVPHVAASVGLFPPPYAAGLRALKLPAATWTGVLLGVPHWLTSLAGMWLAGRLNPRADRAGTSEEAERMGRVLAPGAFGQRYGPLAPPAVFAGHLLYGGVLGWWLGRRGQ
ncbi:MAG: hypothetical protein AB7R89_01910 [Dehalococcoidia bacterium]